VNHPQATLFEQFLRERTYLKNVTPSHARLVSRRLQELQRSVPAGGKRTRASLQQFVIGLRERNI